MEKIKKILIISSDKNLRDILSFCFDGWGYEVFIKDSQIFDMDFVKKVSADVIVVDVQAARRPQLEICRLLKGDLMTAFIPIITIVNKRQLRQQLLDIRQGVDDYLIKPPDPLDLRIRIEMAIKRAQYSFYANSLTCLPGGRIIETVLKEKLKAETSFSFGYADIDNFKYFNDVYGYIKGDRIIMQTAYILYNTVRNFGNSDDFIGHIGGDDFVFITSCDKHMKVCQNFIEMFDRVIPFHYTKEDRQRKFIIARDRTHKMSKIPIASLSLAVVNNTGPMTFKNIVEINDRVAEIKRYLKSTPESKFMVDRRNRKPDSPSGPQIAGKTERGLSSYRPLGQILVENNVINPEQLDEALQINWRRGVVLGETLKQLGFLKDEELAEALSIQENSQNKDKPETNLSLN